MICNKCLNFGSVVERKHVFWHVGLFLLQYHLWPLGMCTRMLS